MTIAQECDTSRTAPTARALQWIGALTLVAFTLAAGCGATESSPGRDGGVVSAAACAPVCAADSCGDDGCGGTCECGADAVCDDQHTCVVSCDQTCATAGWECGDLCGVNCGTCGAGACLWNKCYASDVPVSCDDCPLRLAVVSSAIADGAVTEVVLDIEYLPGIADPRPRLADFRIYANMPATLVGAVAGPALIDAGKELYRDPETGNPWRLRGDRTYQLLAYSIGTTEGLATGQVARLTFRLDSEATPVAFKLLRREQTFAPMEADLALQGHDYDRAVVVSDAE